MHHLLSHNTSSEKVICDLMTVRSYSKLNTSYEHFGLLKNSAEAGTVNIFRDHMERPIGYLVWAQVSSETARIFVKDGMPPVYPYEWNEGPLYLPIDIVVVQKSGCNLQLQLRQWIKMQRVVVLSKRGQGSIYRYGRKILRLSNKPTELNNQVDSR